TRLERELGILARKREERRRRRNESSTPIVALVGYTNAGKSTLLNALTGASVLAADKLFATLDTRARRLALPDGSFAVATDTVGFIRNMPKDLFAAFRATFEEIADADLILEVVDASSAERDEHLETTTQVLEKLELDRIPRLRVYNKSDRIPAEERSLLAQESGSVTISATEPGGAKALLERIGQVIRRPAHRVIARAAS
ncbi:MAG TPA: GTPase HflX, partial [Polyangiaceae bacterium]|nr:GTPase HflX [Polyangiaceae bacterium]